METRNWFSLGVNLVLCAGLLFVAARPWLDIDLDLLRTSAFTAGTILLALGLGLILFTGDKGGK